MGLDQTLYAKKYVGQYGKVKIAITGDPSVHNDRIVYLTEEVMDWRKANAIHKWFVDNVQDGNDDCKTYYVSRDKLKELLRLCKLIGDKSCQCMSQKPEDVLPTQGGFFFGDTAYDKWYFDDIKRTINSLERALKEYDDDWDFEYSASW